MTPIKQDNTNTKMDLKRKQLEYDLMMLEIYEQQKNEKLWFAYWIILSLIVIYSGIRLEDTHERLAAGLLLFGLAIAGLKYETLTTRMKKFENLVKENLTEKYYKEMDERVAESEKMKE